MVEFVAGPAVAIIAGMCFFDALIRRIPLQQFLLYSALSGLGLCLPMAVLAAYNTAAFGSPLHLGYSGVQDFPGMQQGFFGVSTPNLQVVRSLLIGQYRGLLPIAPILLLVPFAFVICFQCRRWRVTGWMTTLVFTWYLLMNSGYYYWWGGFSTGPRHLLPGVPLLSIMLAVLWDRVGINARRVALVILLLSVTISVLLTAVEVATPEYVWSPFFSIWLPALREGRLVRLTANFVGLHGYLGLLPLLIVWTIIGIPFGRALVGSISRVRGNPQRRALLH